MSFAPPKHPRAAVLAIGLTAVLAACSSNESKTSNDSGVDLVTDSSPPDAPPAPECTMTKCGDQCVNTEVNPHHCGGCGMACDSPGQICTGSLPCACPTPFLPAKISPSGFDQVVEQMGVKIALAPQLGAKVNLFAVIYDLDNEVGEEYDLASAAATLSPPGVAAGHDVDIMTMNVHTPYAPTSGTLTFTSLCEDGVAGSIEGAMFEEVSGAFDPTPVAGGCSFSVEELDFQIGSSCTEDLDGGVDSDAS